MPPDCICADGLRSCSNIPSLGERSRYCTQLDLTHTAREDPAVELVYKTEAALQRLEDQIGLMPTARLGLNVAASEANGLDDFTKREVV